MILDDNEDGRVEVAGNELLIDDQVEGEGDPTAIRGGRRTPGALLKICGDIWIEDPIPGDPGRRRRIERAYVQLATDDSGGHGGECSISAHEPGHADDDHTRTLFKINTKVATFHVPVMFLAGIVDAEPPWPGQSVPDETHGIPPGDFAAILNVYGFESDWQDVWHAGRVTWSQVIARQDERDEYRKFPESRPGPPAPSPIPSPTPTPQGDHFTREQRRIFVEALTVEFGFPADAQSAARYIAQGHSPGFRELHDDMKDQRNNGVHDETQHYPGAPY